MNPGVTRSPCGVRVATVVLTAAVTIGSHAAVAAADASGQGRGGAESEIASLPAELSVRSSRVDGGVIRSDVAFGGVVVAAVSARAGDGRLELVALVRPQPDEGNNLPPRLVRLLANPPVAAGVAGGTDGEPLTQVEVAVDLPMGTGGLRAMDVDGDGVDELLLEIRPYHEAADELEGAERRAFAAQPQQVSGVVGWNTATPRLLPLAAGRLGAIATVVAPAPGGAPATGQPGRLSPVAEPLCLVEVGVMRCYAFGPGGFVETQRIPLPTSAKRERNALWLGSPPVVALAVGQADGGAPPAPQASLLAGHELWVGPQMVGGRRVRAWRIGMDVSGAAVREEMWGRLAGPEEILHSRFVRFDGEPALLLLTSDRGSLNLLGKQLLRVLPLRADRTRSGATPRLAVETASRAWHPVELAVADYDGDGLDDLLVAARQGLGGGDLEVNLYRGKGGLSFVPKPRRLVLDTRGARVHLGADLTGDGLADLVVRSRGIATVHPGQAKGAPFAKQPRVSLAIAEDPRQRVVSVGVGTSGATVRDEDRRVASKSGRAGGPVADSKAEVADAGPTADETRGDGEVATVDADASGSDDDGEEDADDDDEDVELEALAAVGALAFGELLLVDLDRNGVSELLTWGGEPTRSVLWVFWLGR